MGYHVRYIAVLPFLVSTLLSAQTAPFDAALASASELLGSRTVLLLDATGHLVVLQHDDYDVVRKDRIALHDIDVDAIVLGTTGSMIVPCQQGRPRCAQSIIYRSDQEVRSSVLRIPVSADPMEAATAVASIRTLLHNIGEVASLRNETSTPHLRSRGTLTNATP
jgi:hypothetical protein